MNTCLTGGRVLGVGEPAVVGPPDDPVWLLPAGCWEGAEPAAEVIVTVAEPPEEFEAPEPLEDRDALATLGLDAGETTTSSGLSALATLPPTSEPATTPNPSVPMTAAAAARGATIHASNGPRSDAAGTGGSASGLPGEAICRPRSMIPAITRDMWCGSGPRRTPHSKQ